MLQPPSRIYRSLWITNSLAHFSIYPQILQISNIIFRCMSTKLWKTSHIHLLYLRADQVMFNLSLQTNPSFYLTILPTQSGSIIRPNCAALNDRRVLNSYRDGALFLTAISSAHRHSMQSTSNAYIVDK